LEHEIPPFEEWLPLQIGQNLSMRRRAYQNHFQVNVQDVETNHVSNDFVKTPALPTGKIYPW